MLGVACGEGRFVGRAVSPGPMFEAVSVSLSPRQREVRCAQSLREQPRASRAAACGAERVGRRDPSHGVPDTARRPMKEPCTHPPIHGSGGPRGASTAPRCPVQLPARGVLGHPTASSTLQAALRGALGSQPPSPAQGGGTALHLAPGSWDPIAVEARIRHSSNSEQPRDNSLSLAPVSKCRWSRLIPPTLSRDPGGT